MLSLYLSFMIAAAPQVPVKASPENSAYALAVADLATVHPADRLYTRYIWITSNQREDLQAVSLVLNLVSRANVLIRPLPVVSKDGKTMLARFDLRWYWSKSADLEDVLRIWEEFRFDPRFNLLLTRDTLRFLPTPVHHERIEWVLEDCEPYTLNGERYTQRWVKHEKEEDTSSLNVVRVVSDILDKRLVATLVDATHSQAPVVNSSYFIVRALTTIQGKGVFHDVYRGLYYELSGIGRSFKKGTDLDNFLAGLGVGNVGSGVTAEQLFDQLQSDQRIAIFRSGVSGKPRRADLFHSLAGRVGESQSIVSITHDIRDDNIDIGTHPVMNLLDFRDDAREVMFEKANGLQGGALFNGAGVLQDVVPPDVAADHLVPEPYTRNLQPFISCIHCHWKENGWKAAKNDAKTLLSKYLDVFGDVGPEGRKIAIQSDVVARLAGLYAGDFEFKVLPRARNDLAANVLRATGPWRASKTQADAAKLAAEQVWGIYRRYVYEMVGASDFLSDAGIQYKGDASTAFNLVVPPVRFRPGEPEDPRKGALGVGLSIPRTDYDLEYSLMAVRAIRTVPTAKAKR